MRSGVEIAPTPPFFVDFFPGAVPIGLDENFRFRVVAAAGIRLPSPHFSNSSVSWRRRGARMQGARRRPPQSPSCSASRRTGSRNAAGLARFQPCHPAPHPRDEKLKAARQRPCFRRDRSRSTIIRKVVRRTGFAPLTYVPCLRMAEMTINVYPYHSGFVPRSFRPMRQLRNLRIFVPLQPFISAWLEGASVTSAPLENLWTFQVCSIGDRFSLES